MGNARRIKGQLSRRLVAPRPVGKGRTLVGSMQRIRASCPGALSQRAAVGTDGQEVIAGQAPTRDTGYRESVPAMHHLGAAGPGARARRPSAVIGVWSIKPAMSPESNASRVWLCAKPWYPCRLAPIGIGHCSRQAGSAIVVGRRPWQAPSPTLLGSGVGQHPAAALDKRPT